MDHAKSTILFSLLVLGASFASYAESAAATWPASTAQANDEIAALPGSAPLIAELESSLDSKKAKVGDAVVAHTTEALKANGKTLLPKNSKLVGHVTQASARSKGDPSSALAIQFDKAIIKKGQEIPVKVVIQAMAAAQRLTAEAAPDLSAMPSGTAAAQGSPMGSSRQAPSGATPNATRTEAPGSSASDAAKGGNPENSPNTGLDNAGRLTPNSHGVIGLEGLHLATDETSAEQGSLITSSGKSVHLDSGIKILLITQ